MNGISQQGVKTRVTASLVGIGLLIGAASSATAQAMARKPTGRPVGRPTAHSPELAEMIAIRIASGESVPAIC